MRHGAKIDTWAVEAFRDHLDILVAAAYTVAGELPEAAQALDLLTPGRAIDEPVQPEHARSELPPAGDRSTSADRMVTVRVGQPLFRSRVMTNYAHSCAFCGLRARRASSSGILLTAGHILPWKDANDHQRLDPHNGLSLCAIHDRGFEWGFLALDDDLRIVASRAVREHYEPEERVGAELLSLHGRPLLKETPGFEPPAAMYIEHHRDRIFERRFRAAVT